MERQPRPHPALTSAIVACALAAVGVAAPATAYADPDTDFSNALHTIGIYAPKDTDAWIAKIACERLDRGVDHNANNSAKFVAAQFLGTTTQQAWQFLGLPIRRTAQTRWPSCSPQNTNRPEHIVNQRSRHDSQNRRATCQIA